MRAGGRAHIIAAVLGAEALVVAGYLFFRPGAVVHGRYLLYPFVWMNVGLLAVAAVPAPRPHPRRGALAAGVAAAYFFLLSYLTGLVAVYPPGGGPELLSGLSVSASAPGWGPRVTYVGETFQGVFIPYRVVGYVALAYLVYVAAMRAATAALPAVVGIGSCVSCTLPLVAPQLVGVVGASAAVGLSVARGFAVDISTVLYCLAVGLLYAAARAGERGEGWSAVR